MLKNLFCDADVSTAGVKFLKGDIFNYFPS